MSFQRQVMVGVAFITGTVAAAVMAHLIVNVLS